MFDALRTDLSKDFDFLNHKLLIAKPSAYLWTQPTRTLT